METNLDPCSDHHYKDDFAEYQKGMGGILYNRDNPFYSHNIHYDPFRQMLSSFILHLQRSVRKNIKASLHHDNWLDYVNSSPLAIYKMELDQLHRESSLETWASPSHYGHYLVWPSIGTFISGFS